MELSKSSKIIQTKAFARQDGLILGAVWIISFILVMRMPQLSIGSFLLLATPFIVIWRQQIFRNEVCEGKLSYRRALYHAIHTFFSATVLLTLVQYLYMEFLDKGAFQQQMLAVLPLYKEYGFSEQEIDAYSTLIKTLTPFNYAFIFFIYNCFSSIILSPIVALFTFRKPKAENN